MSSFKPMKAPSDPINKESLSEISWPRLGSPKINGIRGVNVDGTLLSKTLKVIRNNHTQMKFGQKELAGLDGELAVGNLTAEDCLNKTSSGVMSIEGCPEVSFNVFDIFTVPGRPYIERYKALEKLVKRSRVKDVRLVQHVELKNPAEALKCVDKFLAMGYEGMMLRDPYSAYKHGRATTTEGSLLKFKLFVDSEAIILDVYEGQTNTNDAETKEDGASRRSTRRDGMIPNGTLGGFHVRDLKTGVEFDIGVFKGLTKTDLLSLWKRRVKLKGQLVNYTYTPKGIKDKPLLPVFRSFRHPDDVSLD